MKLFPKQIPVFPLSGVIYFPKTNLPLNIFEQRYIDLVNDVVKRDKFMGMVQSKKEGQEIYKVGCLGKISDFKKSNDGRILINLTGLVRFEVLKEKENAKLYREFNVNYDKFNIDLKKEEGTVDTTLLIDKAKTFFKRKGLLLNWIELNKLENLQKINTLSMIAPIANEEKQKLLEAISLKEKIKVLENIIDFYLHEVDFNTQTIQ